MSSLAPEQLSAAQKAGLDTAFGIATHLLAGYEKLYDLNVRTFRSSIDGQQALFGQLTAVRDPQSFLSLQTGYWQNHAQHVQAYWKDALEIASGLQGELVNAAQDQAGKSQRNLQAFVETMVNNAPAGSEAVVSAWKNVISAATDSANSSYEAARRSAQQVVEAAQTDAGTVANAATRAARSAAATKK
jgi:phasin family protein